MATVVSNFLSVGTLLLNLFISYKNAPEQFRNFAHEISHLHVVYGKVEDQLRNQGSENNTLTLSEKDKSDLKVLYDGLQAIVTELDALLKKYKSLEETPSGLVEGVKREAKKMTWGWEDLVGFRKRIIMHICLLTAFNTSLVWYVCLPLRFLIMVLSDHSYPLPALLWFLKIEVQVFQKYFLHLPWLSHN